MYLTPFDQASTTNGKPQTIYCAENNREDNRRRKTRPPTTYSQFAPRRFAKAVKTTANENHATVMMGSRISQLPNRMTCAPEMNCTVWDLSMAKAPTTDSISNPVPWRKRRNVRKPEGDQAIHPTRVAVISKIEFLVSFLLPLMMSPTTSSAGQSRHANPSAIGRAAERSDSIAQIAQQTKTNARGSNRYQAHANPSVPATSHRTAIPRARIGFTAIKNGKAIKDATHMN